MIIEKLFAELHVLFWPVDLNAVYGEAGNTGRTNT